MNSRLLKEKFLLFRVRAKKDSEAFGEIYDFYVSRIHRFIFFKVPSADVAEDLTSETFLKAWRYLMEKKEVPHLQALLYSVARSVVVDWYRSSACERCELSLDEEGVMELPGKGEERLIREVESGLDMDRVAERLRGLKDDYREVVAMKYLDGMSNREIASALGKTTAHVRVIAHRAVKALSEALDSNVTERDRKVAADNKR
ncbi:MAG: RNA polymerase sigma factor [bacterium]